MSQRYYIFWKRYDKISRSFVVLCKLLMYKQQVCVAEFGFKLLMVCELDIADNDFHMNLYIYIYIYQYWKFHL